MFERPLTGLFVQTIPLLFLLRSHDLAMAARTLTCCIPPSRAALPHVHPIQPVSQITARSGILTPQRLWFLDGEKESLDLNLSSTFLAATGPWLIQRPRGAAMYIENVWDMSQPCAAEEGGRR